MNDNEKKYIRILKQTVYDHISAEIYEQTKDEFVKTDLLKSLLAEKVSPTAPNPLNGYTAILWDKQF